MMQAICLESTRGLRQWSGNGRRAGAMKSQNLGASKEFLTSHGTGDKIVITVSAPNRRLATVRPNQASLDAMARIAEIQRGMNPKAGKDSLEYLREAREGAMYGYGSDE